MFVRLGLTCPIDTKEAETVSFRHGEAQAVNCHLRSLVVNIKDNAFTSQTTASDSWDEAIQ